MHKLSDNVERKFVDTVQLDDWEVETDSGWQPATHIHKTVEYREWRLTLVNDLEIVCADNHIVFNERLEEVFVKDLVKFSLVMTKDGPVQVKDVSEMASSSNMFDLTVDSPDHRFYTNGILSHNTTTAVAVILHYILFNDHKTVALLANKGDAAREILDRIKIAYESLPDWLQQGVIEFNKGSAEFENGSKIIAASTSSSSIRGKSCVTGDTKICVEKDDGIYLIEIEKLINNI